MAEIGDYLAPLDPNKMTDTGMWIWAGLITIVSLLASWFVATLWQKWKAGR